MSEEVTKDLVKWLRDSLKIKITGFVPNHWHDDCMAGIDYLHQLNIPSYAAELTIKTAESLNLTVPKSGFKDSLILKLNDKDIFCFYPGAAHSGDNIVVWIPSEKILFAGCMLKSIDQNNLGNLSDADIAEWPHTIRRVMKKFPHAEIVIPGHGNFGGAELLTHTLKLLEEN
jgi:metallo-beta-lactamase class B